MSENEEFHVKNVKSVSNKHFKETLEKAPLYLTKNKAASFFKTVIGHLDDENIRPDIASAIFTSIIISLSNDILLNEFIEAKCYNNLPYKFKNYHQDIFDILYFVISANPKAVDDKFIKNFKQMLTSDPTKSLTLIAMFSQSFNKIDNPWPMVDLLISESSKLLKPSNLKNYVSLLAYLIRMFPEYRSGRSQHCWNQICSILSSDVDDAIRPCYLSLAVIADSGAQPGAIPLDTICAHLKQKRFQDSVLTLLDILDLPEREASSRKLIGALTKAAEGSQKATLVLMKLASAYLATARVLVNGSAWLGKPLPEVADTLRLFLVILQHAELRQSLADAPDLLAFFGLLLGGEPEPALLSLVCTVLRRIPLSAELVEAFGRAGLAQRFVQLTGDADDEGAQHSAYLLTDTMSRFAYLKEYLTMVDRAAREVAADGPVGDAAAFLLLRLCRYPKCRKRMREKRVEATFRRRMEEPKYQAVAKKIIPILSAE